MPSGPGPASGNGGAGRSGEVVYHGTLADFFENLLHEIDVQRVDLIRILRGLVGKNKIQRHLVALLHHRTVARDHLPDVELQHSRNGPEVLLHAGEEFIGGGGIGGIGPENDDVGKHNAFE